MLATLPRLLRVVYAAVLCMAGTSVFANASPQFAAQVRAHRADMARNASVVAETAQLCTSLPSDREMQEPKCVALRLHMRALAAKHRQESCDTGDSTIPHIARCLLGGLTGSAA
jgi:hypothetical protein